MHKVGIFLQSTYCCCCCVFLLRFPEWKITVSGSLLSFPVDEVWLSLSGARLFIHGGCCCSYKLPEFMQHLLSCPWGLRYASIEMLVRSSNRWNPLPPHLSNIETGEVVTFCNFLKPTTKPTSHGLWGETAQNTSVCSHTEQLQTLLPLDTVRWDVMRTSSIAPLWNIALTSSITLQLSQWRVKLLFLF